MCNLFPCIPISRGGGISLNEGISEKVCQVAQKHAALKKI